MHLAINGQHAWGSACVARTTASWTHEDSLSAWQFVKRASRSVSIFPV